jgi:rubrerythrin
MSLDPQIPSEQLASEGIYGWCPICGYYVTDKKNGFKKCEICEELLRRFIGK